VCIGLTRARLVVAMLSLNVGGTYGSLIFKTGVYGSFTLEFKYADNPQFVAIWNIKGTQARSKNHHYSIPHNGGGKMHSRRLRYYFAPWANVSFHQHETPTHKAESRSNVIGAAIGTKWLIDLCRNMPCMLSLALTDPTSGIFHDVSVCAGPKMAQSIP
jgi:hypothetical protein